MKESTHRNNPSAVNVPPDKVKLNPIQAKLSSPPHLPKNWRSSRRPLSRADVPNVIKGRNRKHAGCSPRRISYPMPSLG